MTAYNDLNPGFAGLLAGLEADTETAIAGEALGFGLPVFGYAGDATRKAYLLRSDVSKLVLSGDLVSLNVVNAVVNGVSIAPVTYGTSHAATMAALVNAFKALAGVEAVLDTTDTNSRTILLRTKGATAVATLVVTLGAGQATATITQGQGSVFLGITQFTQKEGGQYAALDSVNVLVEGRIWCPASGGGNLNKALAAAGGFAASGLDVGAKFRSAVSSNLAEVEIALRNTATTYAYSF